MSKVVHALLEWVSGGSALTALAQITVAICILVFGILRGYYVGILGANRKRSPERQAYGRLRNSLAAGNLAARLYADQLTRFLDWVDRFFGDVDTAERTLFPRAFGLRTPAPLWTVPAFDRCLLLALIYPIAAIFVVWVASGHVGPAEAALGLRPGLSGWQRALVTTGITLPIILYWRSSRTTGRRSLMWLAAGGMLMLLFVAVVTGTGLGAVAAIVGSAVAVAGVAPIAFAVLTVIVFAAAIMFYAVFVDTIADDRGWYVNLANFALGLSAAAFLASLMLGASIAIALIAFAAAGSVTVSLVVAGVGSGAVIMALLIAVATGILARSVLSGWRSHARGSRARSQ